MPRRSPLLYITTTTTTHYLLLLVLMMDKGTHILGNHTPPYNHCKNPVNTTNNEQWDRIPPDFTVAPTCMTLFIDELCKDNFPDVNTENIGPDSECCFFALCSMRVLYVVLPYFCSRSILCEQKYN